MTPLEAILLGAIQGVAEFLPISSKGHLFLAQRWLGLSDPRANLFFVVMLHQASLAAILVYYGRAIARTFAVRRVEVLWVLLGTIPAGLVGVLLKRHLEALYVRPALTFAGFLVTASVLWAAHRRRPGAASLADLTAGRALAVGAAQALALLPGVSRSGMTVGAGVWAGLAGAEAVRFSFYLGAVAIAGAGLVEIRAAAAEGFSAPPPALAAGMLATFLASLGSLALLTRAVKRGWLVYFATYCAVLGAAGLAATAL